MGTQQVGMIDAIVEKAEWFDVVFAWRVQDVGGVLGYKNVCE